MSAEAFDWSKVKVRQVYPPVETLDTSSPPGQATKAPTSKKGSRFAQIPLTWSAVVAKAAGMPKFHVLVMLIHRAWKAKGQPFKFSNAGLKEAGVTRWMKNRVLRELEAAGVIAVRWSATRSPIMTLLSVARMKLVHGYTPPNWCTGAPVFPETGARLHG